MQGKLNPVQLKKCIFDVIKKRREEVLTGAALAEDCAVIKPRDYLLLTSDPITAASNNAGSLAIEISVNDIAASGGEPVAAMLTIIAPINATEDDILTVMQDSEKAAKLRNVEICGGHTEFSDAVNRIVVCCTMAGFTDRAVLSSSPSIGDSIIMTKQAAIEGTSIIASDLENELLALGMTKEEISEAKALGDNISVLADSLAIRQMVTSMHDITEGGIYGAVKEVCSSCGLGAVINADVIPISPVSRKICKLLNLNPYKLISSGSLLMTANNPEQVLKALKEKGILGTVIGKITKETEVYAYENGSKTYLKVEADEITKITHILKGKQS